MFEVIYLTGAAASGKTTLSRTLSGNSRFAVFEYGAELALRVSRGDQSLTQERLRAESARIVRAEHVAETDRALLAFVKAHRRSHHVIIDSHAITKEQYGFRAVPFSNRHLRSVGLTRIVVLRCPPEMTLTRIAADPAGRPQLDHWNAQQYHELQASLAVSYAVNLGITIHFLDSSVGADEVHNRFLMIVDRTSPPR